MVITCDNKVCYSTDLSMFSVVLHLWLYHVTKPNYDISQHTYIYNTCILSPVVTIIVYFLKFNYYGRNMKKILLPLG